MPMLVVVKTSWPLRLNGDSKLGLNAARHVGRVAGVRNAVEQNRELVAAQPRHHVGFANAMLQTTRHRNQQLIADRMAQTVVDVLEAIEVEEEHGELIILVLLRAFDDELQVLSE